MIPLWYGDEACSIIKKNKFNNNNNVYRHTKLTNIYIKQKSLSWALGVLVLWAPGFSMSL